MIKGSIQEEDITIVNIYTPNKGAPQYMTNTLTETKGKNNSNTKIVRDFNTQHMSKPDHPYRKSMRKHRP